MSDFNIGDLVWIPDGTPNYTKIYYDDGSMQYRDCLPVKGPTYGLVRDISCLNGLSQAGRHWLSIQIEDKIYIIHEKDVRKVDNKEATYDQISRSYTNV